MAGIHHVTAISWQGRAQPAVLSKCCRSALRGDHVGHPGTILTFFPWEHAALGRNGVGLAHQTSFRIPASSIGYWAHRFIEKGVAHEASL